MQLQVSEITQSTTRYRFLWGFYVRGFKPWHHCQLCFRGSRAPGIFPDMQDGAVVELHEQTDFFYLHGNAAGPEHLRGELNLHLAVRPKQGAIATVRPTNGALFTIHDAEALEIQPPLLALSHLGDKWTNCKNLRFAAQMYDAPLLGPTAPHTPIRQLREPVQPT